MEVMFNGQLWFFLKNVKRIIGRKTGIRREASGIERCTVSVKMIF